MATLEELERRVNRLETRTNKLENRQNNFERQVNRREIIRLLQEKKAPLSTKYLYTYEEIAQIMNTSTTTVNNIAKEEGLSRKSLYSVK